MLNDVDKEFDLPTEDENGEPIEENVDNDVYEEEDEEVEHDDEFYEANELKSTDEQEIDTTAESEEQFNEASEQLKEIYTDVLASGFITEEQLTEIEVLNAQVNEAYDDILGKEKTDIEKLKNRVEELKEGFVGANPDEILNILTENGTKCWLYKDDDDNVLIDGTSIPELTVLVNKFKMIATDGENEGEFKLNPDFIQMVVKDTGTGDAVKSIDNMYYLSTSKYELIGGTWLNDLPTSKEQQGKFLWIKRVTTYMDESKQPTETQPICVSAQDGENGADGVDGKDGVSLVYKGEFASHPSNPQNGWYYRNTIERKTFVYQSGAWYQMTIDGRDGQNGNDGKDGLSIEYKGTMSNPPSNPKKNWTYKDPDNGIVYIYTGIAWEVMTYDGNNGTDGAPGADGLSVFCTYHDSDTKPATPTGNGTLNGWHTNWTSNVVWVSQKVSSSATTGTWGAPIKMKGQDGATTYTWIKYADDSSGNGLSDSPTNKKYIGFAYNKTTQTESNNKSDYTWSLIKGEKGDTGVKGDTGANGITYYTWIKYSDNSNGNPCYDTPTSSTKYIGIAVNQTTATESADYTKYTWSKFRGDDGLQGIQGEKGEQGIPGINGTNGKTSYFHIKYSPVANPTSSQMTETPSTYIGTYVDYIATDSTDPTKYTWARFEGIQGAKGEQGIPGTNGANGKTSYLHIKYSNDGGKTFTSNNGETPGDYIGQCTDFNVNDPTTVASYKWTKIKGEQGVPGSDGQDGVSAEEIIIQYAKNQSTTIAPTTGWGTSMPSYQEGYYLWYRTRTKWSNSSNYQYSTPICDSSWKAAQEAYAQIKQLKDKISLIVVDGSTQSNLTLTPGAISAIAKDINLKATNITLEGLVTANSNFKILSNGSIEAKNGKFTGSITGSTITGSNIKGGTLTIGDTSEGNFFKIHSDGSFQAGSVDQWNYKATITYGNSGFYVRAWDDANSKERTTTIDGDGVTVGTTVYSDKYISANGETLNIIDHLKVDGNVAIDGYFRMQNSSSALQARDTSGTLRSLAYISASDNSYFGKGLYDAGIGGTIICGNKVTLRSKNEILLQCGGTTSATNTHTIEFTSIDGNGFLRPTVTNVTRLGSANYLWNILYCKNGVNQSSDRNLKENIRYVDENLPDKLAKTISEESDITSEELYNFVKDDLFLAKYNFIGEAEEKIGFIAQDILYNLDGTDNKIGQMIVNVKESEKTNAPLSYNEGNYVNVLAGALKQAILKIEKLEELINGRN